MAGTFEIGKHGAGFGRLPPVKISYAKPAWEQWYSLSEITGHIGGRGFTCGGIKIYKRETKK
ncbi:hypothetical protein [Desulfocucumis palustris]|uniref:hypothetical protein n=1 Tax=Desulfocucumis palustris TaxID=1898651 RepID=UPI000CEA6D29|nr:hypothetical protein [Desulfocucumis palustris]